MHVWFAVALLAAFSACGEKDAPASFTTPHDPFTGRSGLSEKVVTLVSADVEPQPVRGVIDQRRRSFEDGHYQLTIYSVPPPGAVLPFNPSKPRWLSRGHYWLEDCAGRTCTMVLEQVSGYRIDIVTGDSTRVEHFIDAVPVAWGEVGFRMGETTYLWEDALDADH